MEEKTLKDINPKAKEILKVLNDNGFDAFIVGGAVRDSVMGVDPHDWDIATNATPDQVKVLFKTFDSGLKHGTVTAMVENEGFEITTFRTESGYSDGRHPDTVTFTKTIEEDLRRRDFTINAMAMDINGDIIDPYGGIDDISNKLIRAVGNPNDRFQEDALRILRAVRFSSKLDFNIEDQTKEAMLLNCDALENISAERIHSELTKILCSNHPEKISLLSERTVDTPCKSIFDVILPEVQTMFECEQNNPNHYLNVGEHTIEVLKHTSNDIVTRWAAFLHDIGKPETKSVNEKTGFDSFYNHAEKSKEMSNDILSKLKFSNTEKKEILQLVEYHSLNLSKISKIREFAANHSTEFIDKLRDLRLADIAGQSDFERDSKMTQSLDFFRKLQLVIDDKTAIKICDLEINGDDLKDLGYTNKKLGAYLQNVYKQCLGNPSLNDYNKLIKGAAKNAESNGFATGLAIYINSNPEVQFTKSIEVEADIENDKIESIENDNLDEIEK